MAKIKIYNLKGEEKGERDLEKSIFAVEKSPELIAQAVRVQLANKRNPIASTKDRSEVSGGGRKPWKQKGTGNARAGSNRSPIWVGGGITFGPQSVRNFKLSLPKKMTQAALKTVLSQKVKENAIIALEDLEMSKISTAQAAKIIQSLPIKEGRILVILPQINANVEMSFANLPYIKMIHLNNLNIADLLYSTNIITTNAVIDALSAKFGGKA